MAKKKAPVTKAPPTRDASGKLILADDRKPWDRQPGESAAGWETFKMFAMTPAKTRTLNRIDTEVAGLTLSTIRSYSAADRWDERASEWDRVRNAKELDDLEMQRRRLLAERRLIALGFQSAVGQAVRRKVEDLQERLADPTDKLRDIRFRELSLLMRDVDVFERRAFDEPDQTIGFVAVDEQTVEAVLSTQEARADLFAAIRDRMGVRDPLSEPGGPIE